MRNGKRLRRELDIWRVAWQEVETLVDRLEQLRDEDEAPERRMLALLKVARVIEHEQVRMSAGTVGSGQDFLGDPMVDELPSLGSVSIGVSDAWSLDYRKARLPGVDAAEASVANIELAYGDETDSENLDPPEAKTRLSDMPEQVRVIPAREVFELRVREDDPRFVDSDEGLIMLELPSYPRSGSGSVLPTPATTVEIVEDDVKLAPTASLFCRTRRYRATMRDLIAMRLNTEASEVSYASPLSWSELTQNRRDKVEDVAAPYVGSLGEQPWTAGLEAEVQALIDELRSGSSTEGTTFLSLLPNAFIDLVEQVARDAAEALDTETADLALALETMQEVGDDVLDDASEPVSLDAILTALTDASSWLSGQQGAFWDMVSAAATAGSLIATSTELLPFGAAPGATRQDAADALQPALSAIVAARAGRPSLLSRPPEDGELTPFLDEAFQTRVAYPDGSLRLRRTLEWGFRLMWPPRLRWMQQRLRIALWPLGSRVRRPFVNGLRALLEGGGTGLSVAGLELFEDDPLVLGEDAPIGATALITAHPSSIIPSLPLDVGEVALLDADRTSVAVITGVTESADRRLQLVVQPLRVSLQTDAELPGTAGLVTAGTILGHQLARGLGAEELRTGEHADGPHQDGLVEGALALWSQLALVYGWELVEAELKGTDAVSYEGRSVVDPSSRPLRELEVHGTVSPMGRSVALQKVDSDWWDGSEQAVARKGELLLVRGADAEGIVWQGVVEVESAYRTTGKMVSRLEGSGIQRMSTQAEDIVSGEDSSAASPRCVPCGPEEAVAVLVFSQVWLDRELVSDITFRRDFEGFDAPSLAAGVLLPPRVIEQLTGSSVDTSTRRDAEFRCASRLLEDWTRYAR